MLPARWCSTASSATLSWAGYIIEPDGRFPTARNQLEGRIQFEQMLAAAKRGRREARASASIGVRELNVTDLAMFVRPETRELIQKGRARHLVRV
jgi:hypothetical protein